MLFLCVMSIIKDVFIPKGSLVQTISLLSEADQDWGNFFVDGKIVVDIVIGPDHQMGAIGKAFRGVGQAPSETIDIAQTVSGSLEGLEQEFLALLGAQCIHKVGMSEDGSGIGRFLLGVNLVTDVDHEVDLSLLHTLVEDLPHELLSWKMALWTIAADNGDPELFWILDEGPEGTFVALETLEGNSFNVYLVLCSWLEVFEDEGVW
jgi:hypothetical protein